MALQSLTKHFLDQLVDSLDHLPYGIRYIISELRRQLNGKFPGQTKEVDAALGNVLYYRFINPAVCAPEEYDVLTGVNIDTTQRRNLAEVGKLLNIIQNGKVSSADMVQSMLSDFLETSTHRFRDFVAKACDVSSPEDFFQIDEYQDLTAKPTIAITSNEIYQVHSMLVENVDDLVSGRKDPLAVVLQELGPAPPIGSTLDRDRSKTVALTLTNRHVVLSAEAREMSRVWAETKQLVAEVLATNRAKNLVDLLEKPTTENDEARFRQWQAGRNGTSRDSLKAIKKKALDNISVLEAAKKCKRANNYQEIVTAIAQDINMKTKRRTQRQQELVRIRQTLISLQERSKYLDEQKKSFNDYIASCMAQLSSKKRSPKKAPLFSRQWMHARNLEKSGRMPRFGSYKFTAEELRAKGVLVGVEGYTPKQ